MTTVEASTLGRLDPAATVPFGRESMLRRMAAEPISVFIVQRALVMDVAHPKVGQGVSDHSRFRAQPWLRLWGTVDAGLRLVFGDDDVARAAAQQIYRVHDHINGALEQAAGDVAAGDAYTAHDASLLTWVWATLVDSIEVAFTRWVRPYGPGEAESFYGDMVAFARFFGIADHLVPPDRAAFEAYLNNMLDGDLLGATDASRAMARDVLYFSKWNVPAFGVRPLRVLSTHVLDKRLRERLALDLSPSDERFAERLDRLVVAHYTKLPEIRLALPYGYLFLRKPSIGLAAKLRRFF